MRAIGVGSAPASPALFEALHRAFPNAAATNGYGVTEAGPVMFANHPQGKPRPTTSIGYPLEGCEIRLDPGPDEGVLLTRNPGVMAAYHNLPEETARRLKDGWFDTGDVCRRDADGFYYFVGRTDDMFVCGGENVYPGDVEGDAGAASRHSPGGGAARGPCPQGPGPGGVRGGAAGRRGSPRRR